MSPRSWNTRINDMLLCCNNILLFSKNLNFEAFLNDPKTVRAVAFELTTLGEAVRSIPIEIKEKYTEIPWSKIQGIRNILVHEYFLLDEEIIWQTVQQDIPSLIEKLEVIMSDD